MSVLNELIEEGILPPETQTPEKDAVDFMIACMRMSDTVMQVTIPDHHVRTVEECRRELSSFPNQAKANGWSESTCKQLLVTKGIPIDYVVKNWEILFP